MQDISGGEKDFFQLEKNYLSSNIRNTFFGNDKSSFWTVQLIFAEQRGRLIGTETLVIKKNQLSNYQELVFNDQLIYGI